MRCGAERSRGGKCKLRLKANGKCTVHGKPKPKDDTKIKKSKSGLDRKRKRSTEEKKENIFDVRDQETVATVGPYDLNGSDLKSLMPKEWLNDVVINAYISTLKGVQSIKNGSHLLSTRCDVKRWFRKSKIEPEGFLLVPINVKGNHWALCIVNFDERLVYYYDSLPGYSDRNYARELANIIERTYSRLYHRMTIDILRGPIQTNSYDCGVFVLAMAKYVSEGKRPNYSQKDMKKFRRKIAKTLLKYK